MSANTLESKLRERAATELKKRICSSLTPLQLEFGRLSYSDGEKITILGYEKRSGDETPRQEVTIRYDYLLKQLEEVIYNGLVISAGDAAVEKFLRDVESTRDQLEQLQSQ